MESLGSPSRNLRYTHLSIRLGSSFRSGKSLQCHKASGWLESIWSVGKVLKDPGHQTSVNTREAVPYFRTPRNCLVIRIGLILTKKGLWKKERANHMLLIAA